MESKNIGLDYSNAEDKGKRRGVEAKRLRGPHHHF